MKKRSASPISRASKRSGQVAVGVAWYAEDQWGLVKASALDPDAFEPTYREWVNMAEDALREIQRSAGNVVKVHIDSNEFRAWCIARGKQNNSAARAEYASEKLRERNVAA
jgi:hypothetical protein